MCANISAQRPDSSTYELFFIMTFARMNLSQCLFLLLLFTEIASLSPTTSGNGSPHMSLAAKPRPLSVKLIHRNSVSSPYYIPNASPYDLARDAIDTSIERARYLNKRIVVRKNNGSAANEDGGATLLPDYKASLFLANVTIGEPQTVQLVFVDTASSLLWIRCAPCLRCPRQSLQLFNPLKSSTYSKLTCTPTGPTTCAYSWAKCDSQNSCSFSISYFDGTEASGNLASEKLVLGTSDDGIINVTVKVFGCAHENKVPNYKQDSGILGIGFGEGSLARQLGGRFSLCFGDIHDMDYQYNKLSTLQTLVS